MKEFNLWMEQIDPKSISSRVKGDSVFKPRFNQEEYVAYFADGGRARLVDVIGIPEELLQELWREKWSDQ